MGTENERRFTHEDDPDRDLGTPCLARFVASCAGCYRHTTWCHIRTVTMRLIVTKHWRCSECQGRLPILSVIHGQEEVAS